MWNARQDADGGRAGRPTLALLLGGLALAAGPGDAAAAGPTVLQQWSLQRIAAPAAWARRGTDAAETLVAVVDTGVDALHPDLAPRMWRSPAGLPAPSGAGEIPAGSTGWDFIDGDADPRPAGSGPYLPHGTKVAGIVGAAADDGRGIMGVDPHARIVSVRVCGSTANGCTATAAGLEWASSIGARVVNLSVGGSAPSAGEALAIAHHPETLFVVSAGNGGQDVDAPGGGHWPCLDPAPNVICVANSDRDGRLDPTSNYGLTSVDVAAPGVDIVSTAPGGGYALASGTSESAPHVTGVASLLFSTLPTATPAQVRTAILASARTAAALSGRVASGGVLDAAAALDRLRADLVAPRPPLVLPPTRVEGAVAAPHAPSLLSARLTRGPAGRMRLHARLWTANASTRWLLVRTGEGGRRVVAGGRATGRSGESIIDVALPLHTARGALRLVATSAGGRAQRTVRAPVSPT